VAAATTTTTKQRGIEAMIDAVVATGETSVGERVGWNKKS
jgi:hypothetical protein